MSKTAKLSYDGREIELPVIVGTEQEAGMNIARLRADMQLITYDDGYGNTGSCQSNITFIDGEKGILRYRGYPIDQLAEKSDFLETSYLILFGELPTRPQLDHFRGLFNEHMFIPEPMSHHFEGFPTDAPPMAILSAMINTLGCFRRKLVEPANDADFEEASARLISKVRTIAAQAYRTAKGLPRMYPKPELEYTENFMSMMFGMPNSNYQPDPDFAKALDVILLLHADHEQNCSTSTVRMVASSQANLYASISAGVCALWGPLHGGANVAVIKMLEQIQESGQSLDDYVAKVKDKQSSVRLMGFGHRVYKNFDPRAKIIKQACDKVLGKKGIQDPLLDMAKQLEEVALRDEYFIERKLYPNVDFYSGIIMRALGIPLEMFTVMFAMGRMPGWIANWRETYLNPKARIYRPRQIYQGATERDYVPVEKRG